MGVHVEVEIIEDGLWCGEHATHHRAVYLCQPTTHQGVPLGPSGIYDDCIEDEDAANE